jgi:hypothetical protein
MTQRLFVMLLISKMLDIRVYFYNFKRVKLA